MPLQRVALPAPLKKIKTHMEWLIENHQTTAQEWTVSDSLCRWLKELEIRCRVYRNPIIFINGRLLRPDIYIPALGIVIEVDGRAHERCDGEYLYQQRSDERRDERYRNELGLWVFIIPNYVAHNNFQLGMFIKALLKDFKAKPPSKSDYNKTAKALTRARKQFALKYPKELMQLCNGPAGFRVGFKMRHCLGGYSIEIRPSAKKKDGPTLKK